MADAKKVERLCIKHEQYQFILQFSFQLQYVTMEISPSLFE